MFNLSYKKTRIKGSITDIYEIKKINMLEFHGLIILIKIIILKLKRSK
jgi:hypothetical protein